MPNALTVDVEDWHQLLVRYLAHQDMPPTEYAQTGVLELLKLFEKLAVRGTFFLTGRVAESFPGLVPRIQRAGHEVAAHGWDHWPVGGMSREKFAEDLRRTVGVLEEAAQEKVVGYRAPYFSVGPTEGWAFEVMLEQGLAYDSSMSFRRWPEQDWEGSCAGLHRLQEVAGELYEMPVSSVRWLGRRWTVSGGRYFRCLPRSVIRRAFRRLHERQIPAQLYVHTYEVLPGPLRVPCRLPSARRRCAGRLQEMAYAVGRGQTVPRITELVQQFDDWRPIRELVDLAKAKQESA